jgi:CheY-like chemotaxis protein
MNNKNNTIKINRTYIEYIINIIKLDIVNELNNSNKLLSINNNLSENICDNLIQSNNNVLLTIKDCLSLLLLTTSNDENTDIYLNSTINNILNEYYSKLKINNKIVNISFNPFEQEIIIKTDKIIIETIINKIFGIVYDQLKDSNIIVSTNFDYEFATISFNYIGDKNKAMTIINNIEDFRFKDNFSNSISIMKLFEYAGLGTLSFSGDNNHKCINFTFHLPTKLKSINKKNDNILSFGKNNWEDKTILIVDDIEVNFLFLDAILKDTRVKTIYAKNGKEAVDIIKTNNEIDAILMDLKMPVMDGYDASRLIKKHNPNIPIIVQTAYSFNEEYQKCKEIGCEEYITKPLKGQNVISILAKYLK